MPPPMSIAWVGILSLHGCTGSGPAPLVPSTTTIPVVVEPRSPAARMPTPRKVAINRELVKENVRQLASAAIAAHDESFPLALRAACSERPELAFGSGRHPHAPGAYRYCYLSSRAGDAFSVWAVTLPTEQFVSCMQGTADPAPGLHEPSPSNLDDCMRTYLGVLGEHAAARRARATVARLR